MFAHAVAVAPNAGDVAALDQTINERAGHDLVPKDVAPLLKRVVTGENRRRVVVASTHELKDQLRAGALLAVRVGLQDPVLNRLHRPLEFLRRRFGTATRAGRRR